MALRQVLIVDDEPDILAVGRLALTDVGGLEVTEAGSGEAALVAVAESRPDVILLDMMMPGMDGRATIARLHQFDPTLVVIFMTARVQPRERAGYLELGAVGVIGKPFDPMTLAQQIRDIAKARVCGDTGPTRDEIDSSS